MKKKTIKKKEVEVKGYEDNMSLGIEPGGKLTVKVIEDWERLYKEKTGNEMTHINISPAALKVWIGEDGV